MIIIKETVGVMGVNCYIVGNKSEAIIIDPGSSADRILSIIKREGIVVKYVVLTHCHFDHILAVEDILAKLPGAKLVASLGEKENLLSSDINYTNRYSHNPLELTADIYLKDNDILKSRDFSFKILETPGHTSGSICMYCEKEKVLFSGDTLFRSSVGRCDLATGNEKSLVNSIKSKLFVLPDDTIVLPGHGENTTIGFEKMNNPFIY